MIIQKLRIENFRALAHLEFECGDKLNVFIGLNGAGKSTLLDAIQILLSWFTARMLSPTGRGRTIKDSDITQGADSCTLEIELAGGTTWSLYKQRSTIRTKSSNKSDLTSLTTLVNTFFEHLSDPNSVKQVPLITSFGIDRAVNGVPVRLSRKKNLSAITDIYKSSFEQRIDFRSFFEWFREREDIENEHYRTYHTLEEDSQLLAVKNALHKGLPEYKNLRVRRKTNSIKIEKNNETYLFSQLSDGEKCYITLVMDIARRLTIANPESKFPLNEEGIILIDEVDLHLHPAWQQLIVRHLRTAFPNIQFFLTTHSPFVINDIMNDAGESVIALTNGKANIIKSNVYGQSVEFILSKYFDLSTLRNHEVQKRIDTIWELFEAGKEYDPGKVKEIENWLKENININDPELVKINLQKQLLKQKNNL